MDCLADLWMMKVWLERRMDRLIDRRTYGWRGRQADRQ